MFKVLGGSRGLWTGIGDSGFSGFWVFGVRVCLDLVLGGCEFRVCCLCFPLVVSASSLELDLFDWF